MLQVSHDDDEDDLGEFRGKTQLEHAPAARQLVMPWRPTAFGNRPVDWLVRDFLLSSTWSDARLWKFRRICRHLPRWSVVDTMGWPTVHSRIIAQIKALHYLHVMQLLAIEPAVPETHAEKLTKLLRCWPVGMQVTWSGPDARTHRDVCGLAHLCPFCCGRRVAKVYRFLGRELSRERGPSFLLLGTIGLGAEEMDRIVAHEGADQLRLVRALFGREWRSLLQSAGAAGGLTSVQIGPSLFTAPVWHNDERTLVSQTGLRYEFAVLGCVRNATDLRRALHDGRLAQYNDHLRQRFGDGFPSMEWTVRSLQSPAAVRQLLLGNIRSQRKKNYRPIYGMFRPQPWLLANAEQLSSALDTSKGLHLVDRWGSLRKGPTADQTNTSAGTHFVNAPQRHNYRRMSALRRRNRQCKELVDARRTGLLAELKVAQLAKIGRNAVRLHFLSRGRPISDRDARWLAQQLRGNFDAI